MLPELGKVAPYGVYDIAANAGWINLGITSDTAAFAVESIRRWWRELGQSRYQDATRILITADCGGSNGARVRLWKTELQTLADQTGLSITVAHLPPGTSKWNRIEHRLFAFITQNWRGKPLLTHQVIVQLIASTTTAKGLTVQCRLDDNIYNKGIKVSDAEMARLNIKPADFHGTGTTPSDHENPTSETVNLSQALSPTASLILHGGLLPHLSAARTSWQCARQSPREADGRSRTRSLLALHAAGRHLARAHGRSGQDALEN